MWDKFDWEQCSSYTCNTTVCYVILISLSLMLWITNPSVSHDVICTGWTALWSNTIPIILLITTFYLLILIHHFTLKILSDVNKTVDELERFLRCFEGFSFWPHWPIKPVCIVKIYGQTLLKPSMCRTRPRWMIYGLCWRICQYRDNTGIFGKTRSDLKYLLDSLYYLAGSWAPYIHVILYYVMSITWYSGSKNCPNVWPFFKYLFITQC